MSQFQSSGRGGAGNIVDSSKTQQLQPEDLQTPTLKTSMVTTGRGGTGNFAAGLDAEEKRRRQDVVPYALPPPTTYLPPNKTKLTSLLHSVVRRDSHGATHVGRGGTGNVAPATPSPTTAAGGAGAGSPTLAPVRSAERVPSPVAATSATATEKLKREKSPGEKLRRERSRQSATGAGAGAGDDDVAVPARKPEEIGWAERGLNLLFGKK